MTAQPGQLNGKNILVTGASSGIGEAIARRFAAEGACVIVHDRVIDGATTVASSINASGGTAKAIAADLSEPESCVALAARSLAALGGLDILVNNAAYIRRSDVETTDVALWDQIMAVNVRAPFLLFKALLPHFRQRQHGVVLNIGSANAYCGEAKLLPYSVSKGALTTLTRNLADAHGREGIRVNQINLAWVLTENEYKYKVADGLPADWPSRIPLEHAPFGRLMSPDEAAHFALTFVADSAAMVSGSVVELGQFPIIGRNPVKEEL